MRRSALAVLVLLAIVGCAGPAPAPAPEQLPHRSYTGAPGTPSLAPTSPAAASAPATVEALGDRDAPYPATTAEAVAQSAVTLGALADNAAVGPGSCTGIVGCRSAATAGDVTVLVFDTADGAQAWRDTSAGAEVEEIGGRRYWAAVDYSALDGDGRSAWRDVLREIIP